jgi:uncharacterized membrane protein
MMKSLLFSKEVCNLEMIIAYYLRLYDVNFTSYNLKETIDSNINGPSLLTIKDVLFDYGIESVVIRKGRYSFTDFEIPFICLIQKEDWSKPAFTIVTSNDNGAIEYLDPLRNELVSIDLISFETIDKEVLMLLNAEHKKHETNYKQNRIKEKSANIISKIPIYYFVAVILVIFSGMFLGSNPYSWILPFFIITSVVGLFISLLLVWYEIDAHNPFIKEVCGGQGRKKNCDAVLSSSNAKFLGVSWGVWGFTYFASQFISMILFGQHSLYLYLWANISLITILYIPFSLYFQSKIVQQWCPLCLSVLGVILFNAIASFFYLINYSGVEPNQIQSLIHITTLGLIFLLVTYYAVPILKQARERNNYAKRWKKLYYNPEIFQALLDKSEKIHIATDGLGIVIGNPNAQNEIIKVCNPYCGPCSKAHPELEYIIKTNADVKIRIIFTASGDEDDLKTAPVQHLLAIQQKHGRDVTHQALDDWYLADKKDYEAFAQKYPMNGELKQQTEKIQAMRDWCNLMKIRVTPTIYINGAELPDSYSIKDVKNFF